MKIYAIAVIVFLASSTCLQAAPPENDKTADEKDDMTLVGERLFDSLKDDNIVGFSQCWAPSSIVLAWSKHPPEGLPRADPEWIKNIKPHMLERDRLIESFFKPLREKLLRISGGDLSNLTLQSVTGKISQRGSLRRVDRLTVTLQLDKATSVRLVVEDGIEFDGVWFISDDVMMLHLIENGQLQRIFDFKRQAKKQN